MDLFTMASPILIAFGPDPQTPTSSTTNAGVRSEKLRAPRSGCDELEKAPIQRPLRAQEHSRRTPCFECRPPNDEEGWGTSVGYQTTCCFRCKPIAAPGYPS